MTPTVHDILIAVIPTVITAILGYIGYFIRSIHLNNKTTDKAIVVLLRRELTEVYDNIKDKSVITIDELEEFDEIYEVYTSLGGNGRGTTMHDNVHRMEIK